MTNSNIEAIVLAAGTSSRLIGHNKMLLTLGEQTILATTVNALLTTDVRRIIIVTGFESELVQHTIPQSDKIVTVINSEYEKGMMSSIQAGVRAISAEATGFMICLGDMPLLSPGHYNALMTFFIEQYTADPHAIVKPVLGRQPGQPTVFSRFYMDDFLQSDLKNGGLEMITKNKQHFFPFKTTDDAYILDIDTLENYRVIKHRLGL